MRGFAETTHAAKSWRQKRRVAARIEATRQGLHIRNVVTNITTGTPDWFYAVDASRPRHFCTVVGLMP